MKFIFLSIAFTHFAFCQITRLPQCNKYGATFKVSKHKIIRNGSVGRIKIQKKIKSKERCSILCIEHENCKSAFYKPGQKECYLYRKVFEVNELVEAPFRLYLQPNGDEHNLVRNTLYFETSLHTWYYGYSRSLNIYMNLFICFYVI